MKLQPKCLKQSSHYFVVCQVLSFYAIFQCCTCNSALTKTLGLWPTFECKVTSLNELSFISLLHSHYFTIIIKVRRNVEMWKCLRQLNLLYPLKFVKCQILPWICSVHNAKFPPRQLSCQMFRVSMSMFCVYVCLSMSTTKQNFNDCNTQFTSHYLRPSVQQIHILSQLEF